MAPQRYQRVSPNDDDSGSVVASSPLHPIPSSPPPSFRSQTSSPTSRRLLAEHSFATEAEQTLASTFDSPSDGDDSDNEDASGADARQRLMRADPSDRRSGEHSNDEETVSSGGPRPGRIERRVTQLPVFSPQMSSGRGVFGSGSTANDGVFANLSAKPTRGEDVEEKPPTYEQAAADATPPYWETTILAPGMVSDEVFVDGLPVGSVFSFVWNGMISMSFQLVGFVLTYLLHTTHAAKNGSLAGLGITLIQFGFQVKGIGGSSASTPKDPGTDDFSGPPPDPNAHDFDPNAVAPDQQGPSGDTSSSGSFPPNEWLAYVLMIVGWFILIRAISDFLRARRHEQLVLQSPDRGLGVAVVAEGERPESTV